MTDRGDYRSIYCSFWDDPDVHALEHLEYRVLTTLKGTLPASGIGVVYISQLSERCAAATPDVEAALSVLATPLPGKIYGWIVRDKNVAWIVNALRYEPTLTATNRKHRKYLTDRLLAPLGYGRDIVDAYRRYYPEWFVDAAPPPQNEPSDRVSENPDRVSKHSPILSSPIQSFPSQSVASPEPPLVAATAGAVIGTVIGDTASAAVVLVSAANRGITERYGEQPCPLRYDSPSTIEAVEEIEKDGIDIAFARDAIYTAAASCKLSRPPGSVRYFIGSVRDRWGAARAHADAKAIQPNTLTDAPGNPFDALDQWAKDSDAKNRKHA